VSEAQCSKLKGSPKVHVPKWSGPWSRLHRQWVFDRSRDPIECGGALDWMATRPSTSWSLVVVSPLLALLAERAGGEGERFLPAHFRSRSFLNES